VGQDLPMQQRSASPVTFDEMMALESHGPDTFVGTGPQYPWGGLYGGQIVAQALRGAVLTVDPTYRVHSLHAYFIRLGDATEPIRFEVDRIRNGRTFCTRRVVARQSVGAILTLAASFQTREEAPDVQTAELRSIPGPDDLASETWSPVFDRRFVPSQDLRGRATAWLRMSQPLGDDPMLPACALAYLSDDLPTDAVVALHPDRPTERTFEDFPFWSASLDHAIWFHRDFATDDWHAHDFQCHGLLSSRGLSIGQVFTRDGTHVATITQEVLLRHRKT
jgi:acyl-CoA thioesterase-2